MKTDPYTEFMKVEKAMKNILEEHGRQRRIQAGAVSAESRLAYYKALNEAKIKKEKGKEMEKEEEKPLRGKRQGYIEEVGNYNPITREYEATYRKEE